MSRPGKNPGKSMAAVMAERDAHAKQNLQKRAEKIAQLVEDLAGPQANFCFRSSGICEHSHKNTTSSQAK